MNISEKQLARNIIQHVVNDLNVLQTEGDMKWNIPMKERQAQYREWAEMAMKKLIDANDVECIYVGQFDGSAKPNPGLMKIGGYIKNLKHMDRNMYTFSLDKGEGTNNRAEYLALITLLETAISKGIKRMNIYGDSNLAVMQVNGKWKANKDMGPLRDQVLDLLEFFDHWSLSHVPRALNSEADALTR